MRARTVKARLVNMSSAGGAAAVARFFARPAFDAAAETVAGRVLRGIASGGDRAVARCVRTYQGAAVAPSGFRVERSEMKAAAKAVDPAFRRAVRQARARIAAFARAGRRRDWSLGTAGGGRVGEVFRPLDRVGVYVPGGAAPLASTALMTVVLARVAGVKEIVACTPCGRDGRLNPYLLYALAESGATEIYRVGGIQAIGMMAYGTATVAKVQKIVGPGGPYVTAAKRQVYGQVALDLVAGPSEIAVLADSGADPRWVAADLLSQAEHGTGLEKALLVTPSPALARAVQKELGVQARTLSRRKAVERVMRRGVLLVVTDGLSNGAELCNRFAPEHLELMVRRPGRMVKKINRAGAIFVGPWSPESAGDFAAGPSHVLPTGGSAALFSGLTVDDFRRRSSVIALTRKDLRAVLPVVEVFGRVEGLDGHARSARLRFRPK